ncbi:MAG TPA: hypothetical protein DCS07_00790 [Bdellovibrionales bacterium]|nr:MAG: hypothetical protein A2X97_12815 [Bdellovibrionales bacterium GWA1_52_35]OFZ34355.1 MAG: hypothetical protein A2070_03050 [Bdellovibrionales bacterium GWC1_52_8]HAR41166.1 hypothetical protein [Bdellovibrionales bacterium]HCM41546.1 hypothetical protein [Bdellovibrionales bacterium]
MKPFTRNSTGWLETVVHFEAAKGPESLFTLIESEFRKRFAVRLQNRGEATLIPLNHLDAISGLESWNLKAVDLGIKDLDIKLMTWELSTSSEGKHLLLDDAASIVYEPPPESIDGSLRTIGKENSWWKIADTCYRRTKSISEKPVEFTSRKSPKKKGPAGCRHVCFNAYSGPPSLFERISLEYGSSRPLQLTRHALQRAEERGIPQDILTRFDPSRWQIFSSVVALPTGRIVSTQWRIQGSETSHYIVLSSLNRVITCFSQKYRKPSRIKKGRHWEEINQLSTLELKSLRPETLLLGATTHSPASIGVVAQIAAALFFLALTGCAQSQGGSSPTAELIASPLSGYSCFAIRDDAGKVVAGNCVKE